MNKQDKRIAMIVAILIFIAVACRIWDMFANFGGEGADIFLDFFKLLIQDYVCTPVSKLTAGLKACRFLLLDIHTVEFTFRDYTFYLRVGFTFTSELISPSIEPCSSSSSLMFS